MKNMMKSMLALTMLLFSLFVFSGCGRSESGEETAENGEIRLSNIAFPDMKMPAEEQKLLSSVQDLLEGAALDCTGHSYSLEEKLVIRNTLKIPLNITFYVLHYDRNEKIVGSAWLEITEWKPDEKLQAILSGGLDRYTDYDHASIAAEIAYNDHYLRTDFVPLQLQKESGATFTLGMQLPVQFTTKESWGEEPSTFLLTELKSENDQLRICLKKLAGGAKGYEIIDYRVLDRDTSVIVGSGAFSMMNIEDGETIILIDGTQIFDLEPGEYLVELQVGEIREAAQG